MKKNTIAKICELPLEFIEENKSFFQLAKEMKFSNENKYNVISDIKDYLKKHVLLINKWEAWSQDKRTTGGFYFIIGKKNIVGSIGIECVMKDIEFETPLDACSLYIYLEISSILNLEIEDCKISKSNLSGMTVNERLYESRLLDKFDKYKKKDKELAKQILRDLYVDEISINKIIK